MKSPVYGHLSLKLDIQSINSLTRGCIDAQYCGAANESNTSSNTNSDLSLAAASGIGLFDLLAPSLSRYVRRGSESET